MNYNIEQKNLNSMDTHPQGPHHDGECVVPSNAVRIDVLSLGISGADQAQCALIQNSHQRAFCDRDGLKETKSNRPKRRSRGQDFGFIPINIYCENGGQDDDDDVSWDGDDEGDDDLDDSMVQEAKNVEDNELLVSIDVLAVSGSDDDDFPERQPANYLHRARTSRHEDFSTKEPEASVSSISPIKPVTRRWINGRFCDEEVSHPVSLPRTGTLTTEESTDSQESESFRHFSFSDERIGIFEDSWKPIQKNEEQNDRSEPSSRNSDPFLPSSWVSPKSRECKNAPIISLLGAQT